MRSRPPEVRGMAPLVHGRRPWRTGGIHGRRASDGAARRHAGLMVASGVATWRSAWEEKQAVVAKLWASTVVSMAGDRAGLAR